MPPNLPFSSQGWGDGQAALQQLLNLGFLVPVSMEKGFQCFFLNLLGFLRPRASPTPIWIWSLQSYSISSEPKISYGIGQVQFWLSSTTGSHGFHKHSGCLFTHAHLPHAPVLFAFYSSRVSLSVCCAAIFPVSSITSLYVSASLCPTCDLLSRCPLHYLEDLLLQDCSAEALTANMQYTINNL